MQVKSEIYLPGGCRLSLRCYVPVTDAVLDQDKMDTLF